MAPRRDLPTLPSDAAERLERVIEGISKAHADQAAQWFALFLQLGRASTGIARNDLETTADALVRVASLECELCGDCEISGSLADEFEDAFGREES